MKKIAILGAGAMGRMLAWTLRQGGLEVVLVCRREEQAEALRREGVRLVEAEGQEHVVAVEAVTGAQLPPVDGVILTVKSYDTRAAAELLAERVPDVPVLSLQNGLGNAEVLAEFIAEERIAIGLTTHGATAERETTVHYKGRGATVVGGAEAERWKALFDSCGHEMNISEEIRTEVWRKAMVNIGINPFTAIHYVTNGELLERPWVLNQMRATVEEAERVAAAEGILLENSFERVLEVCRVTAGNNSSMLQDVERGRRTEIEALCGVIVRLGEKHGLPTPYNAWCLEKVSEAGMRTGGL